VPFEPEVIEHLLQFENELTTTTVLGRIGMTLHMPQAVELKDLCHIIVACSKDTYRGHPCHPWSAHQCVHYVGGSSLELDWQLISILAQKEQHEPD